MMAVQRLVPKAPLVVGLASRGVRLMPEVLSGLGNEQLSIWQIACVVLGSASCQPPKPESPVILHFPSSKS